MPARLHRLIPLVAIAIGCWFQAPAVSEAQTLSGAPRRWNGPYTEESQPDVFYNLYVPGAGGTPAAAYPAPLPTPPIVGHTYYTYQPFMPAEWMYRHHRSYHQHYNQGRGLNRTLVRWYNPPIRSAVHGVRGWFELPR